MDRETIESTALDLFKSRTYEEVKVSDICQACGITKPTFYHYVHSKDDLLVTYYDQAVRRMGESLADVQEGRGPWEQLEACFGVLMDETEHIGPELLGLIISINIQQDRHSFDRRAEVTERLVAIIESGQRCGRFKNTRPAEELYEASAHMFQGYELLWCIRKGRTDWRGSFLSGLRSLLQVG